MQDSLVTQIASAFITKNWNCFKERPRNDEAFAAIAKLQSSGVFVIARLAVKNLGIR